MRLASLAFTAALALCFNFSNPVASHAPFTVGYLYSGDINTRKGGFVVKPRNMFRQFNNRVVDWLEDDPEHILMAYSDGLTIMVFP